MNSTNIQRNLTSVGMRSVIKDISSRKRGDITVDFYDSDDLSLIIIEEMKQEEIDTTA